jgi:hypothetical protein
MGLLDDARHLSFSAHGDRFLLFLSFIFIHGSTIENFGAAA